jgi:hypothetical protein
MPNFLFNRFPLCRKTGDPGRFFRVSAKSGRAFWPPHLVWGSWHAHTSRDACVLFQYAVCPDRESWHRIWMTKNPVLFHSAAPCNTISASSSTSIYRLALEYTCEHPTSRCDSSTWCACFYLVLLSKSPPSPSSCFSIRNEFKA